MLICYLASKSLEEPIFYSVEEHHDALTLPSVTHQYATLRRAPPSSEHPTSSSSFRRHPESSNKDDLFRDVESLLALHLPSSSHSFAYQQGGKLLSLFSNKLEVLNCSYRNTTYSDAVRSVEFYTALYGKAQLK